MTKKNVHIADNIFYVVEEQNKFAIVANGIELYEFIGYEGWCVKALNKITKREDANALADFLNRLFDFGQQHKQKEIQKVLGIIPKEGIEDIIKQNVADNEERFSDNFAYQARNTDVIDNIIDKKIERLR